MADLLAKIQSTTETSPQDVYTCPLKRTTRVTVYLCNRGGATTFRLAISPNGAADACQHYIYWDAPLPKANTFKEQFTLNAGDVIRAQGGHSMISVNVFIDESGDLA